MHRCRIGFAERLELRIEQTGPKVLALANDRGVRHAVQNIAHLFGDRVQCAADDLQRDRINFLTHGDLPFRLHQARAMCMSPCNSTTARYPGGSNVVELCCTTSAGPFTMSPLSSLLRW
jgi:hypothetical protein